jgi:hypothetical protein
MGIVAVSTCMDNRVRIYNLETGTLVRTIEAGAGKQMVTCVDVSSNRITSV